MSVHNLLRYFLVHLFSFWIWSTSTFFKFVFHRRKKTSSYVKEQFSFQWWTVTLKAVCQFKDHLYSSAQIKRCIIHSSRGCNSWVWPRCVPSRRNGSSWAAAGWKTRPATRDRNCGRKRTPTPAGGNEGVITAALRKHACVTIVSCILPVAVTVGAARKIPQSRSEALKRERRNSIPVPLVECKRFCLDKVPSFPSFFVTWMREKNSLVRLRGCICVTYCNKILVFCFVSANKQNTISHPACRYQMFWQRHINIIKTLFVKSWKHNIFTIEMSPNITRTYFRWVCLSASCTTCRTAWPYEPISCCFSPTHPFDCYHEDSCSDGAGVDAVAPSVLVDPHSRGQHPKHGEWWAFGFIEISKRWMSVREHEYTFLTR